MSLRELHTQINELYSYANNAKHSPSPESSGHIGQMSAEGFMYVFKSIQSVGEKMVRNEEERDEREAKLWKQLEVLQEQNRLLLLEIQQMKERGDA